MCAVLVIVYGTLPLVNSIGWTGMAVVFGIAGCALLLITFFGTKERTSGESETAQDAEKIPTGEAFKLLFRNKYFIFAALLFIINYAAMNLTNGMGVYYVKEILGNTGAYGTVTAMGFIPSLIGLPFFPKLVEKFGKWKCMMVGYVLQIIGLAIVLLFPTNLTILIIGLFIKGIGMVPHSAGLFAMVADVVDYGDWKFGKRVEAMTYSCTSFGMKVGTGLGSAAVGWGIALGGYDGTVTTQTQSALTAIQALYTWVPMLMVVAGLIVLAMSNLDKMLPQIQKDLAERNAKR
jgi:GPH family glycoside/pentoside/hexuronide:cation symporter